MDQIYINLQHPINLLHINDIMTCAQLIIVTSTLKYLAQVGNPLCFYNNGNITVK